MTQPISLASIEREIARRRLEKAQYFAGLLFLYEIPSSQLDIKRDLEWIELQRAAATHGKSYGVPNITTRLCILAILREYEFRKGQMSSEFGLIAGAA